MSPANFLARVLEPGLALVPSYMVSDEARVLLMAIAGQESALSARAQAGTGSAHGYWQFERPGVGGVMMSPGQGVLTSACSTLDVPPYAGTIWEAIEYNDSLACVVARLCLWADQAPLPAIGDETVAWIYYVHNWKPGKPDKSRWASAYATAMRSMGHGS